MPASADRIRREVDGHIKETMHHKGLTLTIEVTAMDNGIFRVYSTPMAPGLDHDAAAESACEHAANLIKELHRRSAGRRTHANHDG